MNTRTRDWITFTERLVVQISVIGCGYLGAVHATAMASLGHTVVGVDVQAELIASLQAGRAPFFEPGFDELLSETLATGRLTFSTDISAAASASVHFIAVGTPQSEHNGSADTSAVFAATAALLPLLRDDSVVVGKSTVPVGTAEAVQATIAAAGCGATVIWNPEFLRESFAIADTLHPDRIVYGLPNAELHNADRTRRAQEQLDAVYAPIIAEGMPLLVTDLATAQLVKVAANAFLATKISFINALSVLTDQVGADVVQLADAIGHDQRIGRKFLNAGLGFGGGCLPKDVRAFAARAEELGVGETFAFLHEVDTINRAQRDRVVELALAQLPPPPERHQCRVAVLGLSFKPNSDDVRDSPSVEVALRLQAAGVQVIAADPAASARAATAHPALHTTPDIATALAGAHLVVLGTEWQAFIAIDPAWAATIVETRTIIDARNVLDHERWRAAGWTVHGIGRGNTAPAP